MNASIGLRERGGRAPLAVLARNFIEWMAQILGKHREAEVKNRLLVFVRKTNGDVLVDQHGNAAWLEIWREYDEDYVMLLRSSIIGHFGLDLRGTTLHWVGGFHSVVEANVPVRSDIFCARMSFMDSACGLPSNWAWSDKPGLSADQASMLEQALRNG